MRVRWPLSQVSGPARTSSPPRPVREVDPVPDPARRDPHHEHRDEQGDQQQEQHDRADGAHLSAAARAGSPTGPPASPAAGSCPVYSRSTSRASSAVSTTRIRSMSSGFAIPPSTTAVRSQSSRPCQYSRPTSTTGNRSILWVCIRKSASNSSSKVPRPPGMTTNPLEYFTNIVLREKK